METIIKIEPESGKFCGIPIVLLLLPFLDDGIECILIELQCSGGIQCNKKIEFNYICQCLHRRCID